MFQQFKTQMLESVFGIVFFLKMIHLSRDTLKNKYIQRSSVLHNTVLQTWIVAAHVFRAQQKNMSSKDILENLI
jgi:ethanolamine utilization cobalamin adenosyltransferase